jgi:hypothetical protein
VQLPFLDVDNIGVWWSRSRAGRGAGATRMVFILLFLKKLTRSTPLLERHWISHRIKLKSGKIIRIYGHNFRPFFSEGRSSSLEETLLMASAILTAEYYLPILLASQVVWSRSEYLMCCNLQH